MAERYLEREDKYDVDPGWRLPELASGLPSGSRQERTTVRFSSLYYDTADFALLNQRITLRRRTGDSDTGWQLKLPEGAARLELRLPDKEGPKVPTELQDLTLGIRLGARLVPVAKIDTERRVLQIVDNAGRQLAEVADDLVLAAALGETVTISRWREVEVELGAGDEALLRAVGDRLREAGARLALGPSKLARALDRQPAAPESPKAGLATVVFDYLNSQYQALITGDLALRQGETSSHQTLLLHQTRVAAHRYRSVLRVFADLFETTAATDLDRELRWYAGLLGEVSGCQILGKRLGKAARALPERLVLGPSAPSIEQQLRDEELIAQRQLSQAMATPRYLALLRCLGEWQRQPPLTPAAHQPASRLVNYLDDAEHKSASRLRNAIRAGASDVELRRAHKAARRARYTAELSVRLLGKPARHVLKESKRLQAQLGEHHERVVAAGTLLRLGAGAESRVGESGFSYGILYCKQRHEVEAGRQSFKVARKN